MYIVLLTFKTDHGQIGQLHASFDVCSIVQSTRERPLEMVLYERQIKEPGYYLVFLSCTVVESVIFLVTFIFVFIGVTGIN